MPVTTVKVKWGKETYQVDLNPEDGLETFQGQLLALTSVEPSRQKIMIKGKVIKTNAELQALKLRKTSMFMLMGSTAEIVNGPTKEVVFAEDLPEDTTALTAYAPGIENLGNTCYMNSTIQCLRQVPELETALETFGKDPQTSGLAKDLALMFVTIKNATSGDLVTMTANRFLTTLRQVNPQFGERDQSGHFSQQDASEFWNQVLLTLQNSVPRLVDGKLAAEPATQGSSIVDQYFSINMKTTMTCAESADEAPVVSSEKMFNLSCHIDKDVGYLMSGVKKSLAGSIEKTSSSLGRNALYTKTSEVSRLPGYLTVNFVRFYFKQESQTNCKVRKDVKFSMTFDAYDLCTPELKAKLIPGREAHKKYNDYEAEKAEADVAAGKKKGEVAEPTEFEPYSFPDDPGSNNSGYYELVAVLTHQGRASNSGHYVGWVRQKKDEWLLYDDDKVTKQTPADILKLSGGAADWHTAYILLYAAKKCPKIPADAIKADATEVQPMETDAPSS